MFKKPLALGGLVIFALGAGVGSCTGQQSGGHPTSGKPAVPAPGKTVTRYVDKPRDVESLPAKCKAVLDSISQVEPNEAVLVNIYQLALDTLGSAHEAMTEKDGAALNRARTKLYQLDGRSNEAAQELTIKLWPSILKDLKNCRDTAAYKEKTAWQTSPSVTTGPGGSSTPSSPSPERLATHSSRTKLSSDRIAT